MGETKLNVKVTSYLSNGSITSKTSAGFWDSDDNTEIKQLASYACSRISDVVTLRHMFELKEEYKKRR